MGGKENSRPLGNLETRPRGEEEGVGGGGSMIHHHDSDSESLSNSPTSLASSVLGGNDSGTNFTGSSSSSSSSSSGGCCSGSITEEEVEEDDGCLDDWEAVADALAAKDKQESQFSESPPEHEPIPQMASSCQALNGESGSGVGNSKPEIMSSMPRSSVSNGKAWRPDDAFRPQSLPNLSKQLSLPSSDRQHYGCGGVPWACNNMMPPPSSCPICTEDLDLTDSSFLPCMCGFRLCLFCYKRIIDDDGRCPGCRKPYERNPVEAEAGACGGSLTFRLARSCSMITRS